MRDARRSRAEHRPAGHPTPEAKQAPRLRVEGMSKAFGGREVVSGVSFTLASHELVALLGPSGAGKTTLFRCCTGLLAPDTGRVAFEGAGSDRRQTGQRPMAIVFQDYNLVRRLTALENVLGGRLGHVAAWRGILRRFQRADRLKAFECLERVGMLDHAHERADRLSGGQQQRVAIARALAQQTQIIVADEPVASLDPASAAGVLQLLRNIARSDGVAVICSLHQVGYARTFADRIIGLSSGRIVIDARTHELSDRDFEQLYAAGSLLGGVSVDQPHPRQETMSSARTSL
jgi:phosphonate transport system ATP-binding protein